MGSEWSRRRFLKGAGAGTLGLMALGGARLMWERGDYARLVDAFGTVIDEIIVWPAEPEPAARPAGTPSSGARASG
jgi:hypothetical protein